jgi:hypothetical protein
MIRRRPAGIKRAGRSRADTRGHTATNPRAERQPPDDVGASCQAPLTLTRLHSQGFATGWDLLGLANTQASGQRWFIIGFDDKTHEYAGPPDEKLTQQNLEQLINAYIEPKVEVRYKTVQHYTGLVGKLEVIREREKLPYRVSKRLEYQRRRKTRSLEVGQWFVRHSSQTEPPTDDERAVIEAEGERARERRAAEE